MSSFFETFFSYKKQVDLLSFENKAREIEKIINLTDIIVVFGQKGDGKSFFLRLLSKRLRDFQLLSFSQLISKRTKKNEKLIIDDFHLITLLPEEKIIETLDSLKNKKIIVSFNPKYLEKSNSLKKEVIKDFLENSFYTVNLRDFYEEKEKILVDLFLSILEEEFNIKSEEENKEILSFIIKNKNLNVLSVKKLFLHLYLRIKGDLEKNKIDKLDIRKYLPNNLISSYYWYKELNSNKEKIDLSSIYNKRIKEIKEYKKEESKEIMDINQIMDKYLESSKENGLIDLIKRNPSLLDKELFVYDYKDEIMYKGTSLKEIIKDLEKPDLIGYKNDKLYLIYIFENLEEVNLKLLEDLLKLKKENSDLEFIIVTKKKERNKRFIENYNLKENFNIIEV
ncbi:MAG TPA: hypothetical protein EYH54_03325 [Nautiliaceae bacterium]|nr:hypothetical protein [Nautiliaceae bacterium]